MALQKEYIEIERGKSPKIIVWPYYVTSLINKLPPMKRLYQDPETKIHPYEIICLPGVHTYPKGEKDEAESFWEEGYLHRI